MEYIGFFPDISITLPAVKIVQYEQVKVVWDNNKVLY
jgi:hypothetical protein